MEKTERVILEISEFEDWLNETEKEIPSDSECNVTNSGELFQIKTKFHTLKEKCDARTEEFRNLNETGKNFCIYIYFNLEITRRSFETGPYVSPCGTSFLFISKVILNA